MHRERGSSLVEVLVAATIVIVALTSLVHVIVIAAAANQRAKAQTTATILAQAKLEQMIADEAVSSGADYIDSSGDSMGDAVGPPPGAMFARHWSAEALPGDPGSFVLQVSVAILRDGVEAARLVSLKTSSLR